MSLYRLEVLEHRKGRAFGEVTVHQPASLSAFSWLGACAVVLCVGFVSFGSFARKETVTGWVVPEHGLAQVHALKGGTVTEVLVRSGDRVAAGAPLATLSLDTSGRDGAFSAREKADLNARLSELDIQLAEAARSQAADLDRLRQRHAALKAEREQLEQQKILQSRMLDNVHAQYDRALPLLAKGYVSALSMDQRQQAVLAQEQVLADLVRQIGNKDADIADAATQIRALPATAEAQASQLRSAKAILRQSLTELDIQTSNVLRAPTAGRVAYVNLKPGDTLNAQLPVFAIAPNTSSVEVELFLPTRAAGFVARDQEVRLLVDAFPFAHFGAIKGRVREINTASLRPGQIATPIEVREPVYRVVVALPRQSILAYGVDRPLSPGMTLRADIITDRRPIIMWMFDPLIAARRRMS